MTTEHAVERGNSSVEPSTPVPEEASASEPSRRVEPTRLTGILFIILGALGLAGAFALTLDKFSILEDPTFQPACNLNPVLSCGSVIITDQAEVFGFPNPMIGLISFPIVIMMGVLLAGGVPLPRWMLGGFALGSALGAAFVHWLAYQSIFDIGALCPWCMVVWTVTLPTALWTALLAFRAERLWQVRFLLLFLWYLVFVATATVQFWDYWSTLL